MYIPQKCPLTSSPCAGIYSAHDTQSATVPGNRCGAYLPYELSKNGLTCPWTLLLSTNPCANLPAGWQRCPAVPALQGVPPPSQAGTPWHSEDAVGQEGAVESGAECAAHQAAAAGQHRHLCFVSTCQLGMSSNYVSLAVACMEQACLTRGRLEGPPLQPVIHLCASI